MRPVALAAALLLLGCPTSTPEPPGPPAREPLPDRATDVLCAPLNAQGEARALLSETGCFPEGAPSGDLIPFTVRSPLWTDGALKERWLAVPPDQVIGFSPNGAWSFPEGSVLAKSFLRDVDDVVEIRLMTKRVDGWTFASYMQSGDDATYVEEAVIEPIPMADGSTVDWYFPDPAACATCHADGALGPVSAQLDTAYDYGDGVRSQLAEFARVGLFDTDAPNADFVLPEPSDEAEPLQGRARSWLHANCAHCHQPGGWTPPEMDMDLRADTPFGAARLCGVPVQFETAPEAGAWRIAPGDSADSALWGRPAAAGIMRMPPLGVTRLDPLAADLLPSWIDGLTDCPE